MDSITYKQKYLKYKNKYLEFKTHQNVQSGGFMYSEGQYLFFIPESKKNIIRNELIITDSTIPSLDTYTNKLGNCTRFMRICLHAAGDNKTIYTNQSATEAIKRVSGETYDTIKTKTNEVLDKTQQGLSSAWKSIKEGSKALTSSFNKGTAQEGGNEHCKEPIQLPNELKGFSFDMDVTDKSLVPYINMINLKDGDNNGDGVVDANADKIGRVIIIEKKTDLSGLNGETRLKCVFNVSYDNGNTVVTKEKE